MGSEHQTISILDSRLDPRPLGSVNVIGRHGDVSFLSVVWAVLNQASRRLLGDRHSAKTLRQLADFRRGFLQIRVSEEVIRQSITAAA